jgi:hypothetical protein
MEGVLTGLVNLGWVVGWVAWSVACLAYMAAVCIADYGYGYWISNKRAVERIHWGGNPAKLGFVCLPLYSASLRDCYAAVVYLEALGSGFPRLIEGLTRSARYM